MYNIINQRFPKNPFKGTNLFGGELAKLQKAEKKHGRSLTMFPPPAASLQTNTTKPYTGRGRSLRKCGYSYKRGGRDRDQDRSTASATTTKPSNHHDCYSTSRHKQT